MDGGAAPTTLDSGYSAYRADEITVTPEGVRVIFRRVTKERPFGTTARIVTRWLQRWARRRDWLLGRIEVVEQYNVWEVRNEVGGFTLGVQMTPELERVRAGIASMLSQPDVRRGDTMHFPIYGALIATHQYKPFPLE